MTTQPGHGTAGIYFTIAVLALSGLPIVMMRQLLGALRHHYRPAVAAFFLVSRLGLLAVFLVVLGRATGPDSDTWVLHGQSALQGLRPYIDYPSEYGPLFSYLLAPAFFVLPATLAPVVVFIVFDGLVFLLLHFVDRDIELSRRAAYLYLVSPISWFMVVRYGQDESIGALALVGLLLLDRRGRRWLEIPVAVLATIVSKYLVLLAAGMVLLRGRRAWLRYGTAVLIVAAVCLAFAGMRGDLLLWASGDAMRHGPNVWQMFEPVFRVSGAAAAAVFLGVVALMGGWIMIRWQRVSPIDAGLGLFGIVMLFSPKAWTPYALLFLPLLCALVACTPSLARLSLLALYGFLVNFYVLAYPALWMNHGAIWRVIAYLAVVLLVLAHAALVGRLVAKLLRVESRPPSLECDASAGRGT